eukprot:GHRR01025230.1.p2 GENE.GHRR01025230.1~~GHRR01025230.1.p2  ORF type:complete len:120 (+),score=38.17 GHRR01025230.1:821-1180(+)
MAGLVTTQELQATLDSLVTPEDPATAPATIVQPVATGNDSSPQSGEDTETPIEVPSPDTYTPDDSSPPASPVTPPTPSTPSPPATGGDGRQLSPAGSSAGIAAVGAALLAAPALLALLL